MKAQRRRIDREQYGVELAKKDFYPDFSVGLTYFNRPGMPEMYGVNVGVKIPLYFWQKQRPAVAEATASVAAEMGVFVLLYLDLSYEEMRANGLMKTGEQLREAIVNGTVMRLRPMFMTVAVDFIGLIPVMLAAGTGADLTKRIAAPLVAGMFTSFVMGLVVYPAIYSVWKWHTEVKKQAAV